MYIVLFAVLFFCYAFKRNRSNTKIDFVLWILLTLILAFRYGQGSDYFAYEYIFNQFDAIEMVIYNPNQIHSELGFRVLCYLFRSSFKLFIFVTSIFEMFCLWRFISRRNSNYNRVYSLVLFYPTYYLTYYFSALREGIVIAIFIGFLLDYLENKRYVLYCFFSLICVSIHTVSIVFILIPLFYNYFTYKQLLGISFCSCIFGLISVACGFSSLFVQIPLIGNAFSTYSSGAFSISSFAERVISFSIICVLYSQANIGPKEIELFMKVYTIGYILYFPLISFSLISSRVLALFKIFEIVIIPYLCGILGKTKLWKLAVYATAYFLVVSSFMTYKNINSYIEQGKYYDWVSVIDYPYINVINQDTIFDYRDSSVYYDLIT